MTKHRNDYQGITFIPQLDEEGDLPLGDRAPRRSWLTLSLLLTCYAATAASAVACVHSLSGWLIIGLTPVLLLDRFTFRILSPTGPESRPLQVAIRAGYMLLGAFGFMYLQDAAISQGEAFYAGVVLSLVTFLFEYCIEWAFWLKRWVSNASPFDSKAGPLNTAVLAVLIALPLVVLHPLMSLHPLRSAPAETPAKFELDYHEVSVPTSDGLNLAGWFVPADKPRGTVVYCHGYGQNRGQVVSVLEPLHALKLNVLAFDFRGHGGSPGHTVTFGDREVRDLQAAVEYVRRESPGRPVFIVAVSYGASVTLQALPKLGDIAGVWVDSTFSKLQSVMYRNFEFAPEFARPSLVALGSFLIWLDCGMMTTEINPMDAIQHVRVPIHFCHSMSDRLTEIGEAQAVYNVYNGPKWHYWIDESVNHGLTKPAHSAYFLRLRRFFEQRLSERETLPVSTHAAEPQ
jgi:alpha/beta superfamily hydrolase